MRAVEHQAQDVQAGVQGDVGEEVTPLGADALVILEHVIAVELDLPAGQGVALQRRAVEDRRRACLPRSRRTVTLEISRLRISPLPIKGSETFLDAESKAESFRLG